MAALRAALCQQEFEHWAGVSHTASWSVAREDVGLYRHNRRESGIGLLIYLHEAGSAGLLSILWHRWQTDDRQSGLRQHRPMACWPWVGNNHEDKSSLYSLYSFQRRHTGTRRDDILELNIMPYTCSFWSLCIWYCLMAYTVIVWLHCTECEAPSRVLYVV